MEIQRQKVIGAQGLQAWAMLPVMLHHQVIDTDGWVAVTDIEATTCEEMTENASEVWLSRECEV